MTKPTLTYGFIMVCLLISTITWGQEGYSTDPLQAQFVTEDVDRFWQAFDQLDATEGNPFEAYVAQGTPGLVGFTPGRILSAEALFAMVQARKADYEKSRYVLNDLPAQKKRVKAIYSALKYWYPDAVFPPVYFVVGRFNSGGTISQAGLLIGAEMLENLDGMPGLVAHELIHYQQALSQDINLLRQAIIEGSADFIGELISGSHINEEAFSYGEAHEADLCLEFALSLDKTTYEDWMYGTTGKDDRPNDLGYWIGYKISAAYFEKQTDKHQAIRDILALEDPMALLKASGYLDPYLAKAAAMSAAEKADLLRPYSKETYQVTFQVTVPEATDTVYITGNQPELADWNPQQLQLEVVGPNERAITLEVHLPAAFKFTRGSWPTEANVEGVYGRPNLRITKASGQPKEYVVTSWLDRASKSTP